MSFVIGRGLLRHGFSSNPQDYVAAIGIRFDNTTHALLALKVLQGRIDGWTQSSVQENTLVWFGGGIDVQHCVRVLASFGADPQAITNVNKDRKFGNDFEVVIEVKPDQRVLN